MSSFHDVRLPEDIERGALGGPEFKTTVLEIESGFEQRNIDWAETRGEWDVGYGLLVKDNLNETDLDEIIAFFYVRRGQAFSFRFKDFSDFEIGDFNNPTFNNQAIALGDDATTAFQVFKQYQSGSDFYNRPLTKLVSGTVVVLLDNVVQTESVDYTVDLITGIVTFTTAPLLNEIVAVALEFDNHVRFDTDKLDISMEIFNAGATPNIPIVEVRGTGC